MKLFHISDLHIGKQLNGYSLIEDQKYIFRQIVQLAQTHKVDGILIAGDVFDRNIPSAEAVDVLDSFLYALFHIQIPVFIIAGNHDSPERINFANRMLNESHTYISGKFHGRCIKHSLSDEYGKVNFYLMPFIKPSYVKQFFPDRNISSFQDAVQTVLDNENINPSERNILVAHQFVTYNGNKPETSDSETIYVGGVDNVSAECMKKFDYVALGHIHKPQNIAENIRYCGTPLKYSLSEARHKKSVTVIDLKEKGNISLSYIPLQPLHEMQSISGTIERLTSPVFYSQINRENYIYVTLTDKEPVFDANGRLRPIYPHLLSIKFENAPSCENKETVQAIEENELNRNEAEQFATFFEKMNGTAMTEKQSAFMEKLINGLKI